MGFLNFQCHRRRRRSRRSRSPVIPSSSAGCPRYTLTVSSCITLSTTEKLAGMLSYHITLILYCFPLSLKEIWHLGGKTMVSHLLTVIYDALQITLLCKAFWQQQLGADWPMLLPMCHTFAKRRGKLTKSFILSQNQMMYFYLMTTSLQLFGCAGLANAIY